jgi:hypothetical protein
MRPAPCRRPLWFALPPEAGTSLVTQGNPFLPVLLVCASQVRRFFQEHLLR